MIPLDGQPILTAGEMRAAEEAAIAAGTSVDTLMERAGEGVAVAVHRLAAGADILILCGPGNNGGDGYVAAAALHRMGAAVRVAASGAPASPAAIRAAAWWHGPVEVLAQAEPATILVDALFGTGLSRPLADEVAAPLHRLAHAARLRIAVDVPSGIGSDDGAVLGAATCDITLALGAAKPAHLLQPAAQACGTVRLLMLGIPTISHVHILSSPLPEGERDMACVAPSITLPTPGPNSHKYTRGMVAIVAGGMAGASELASIAAMRAGAGYVLHLGEGQGPPHALVRKPFSAEALQDPRIGAIVVGPGLGRDDAARCMLDASLAAHRPLVIDGDALRLIDATMIPAGSILTPHAGEFAHLFGQEGDKITRTRRAAAQTGAVIVHKGPDTVIAAPDGRVMVAGEGSPWLSTAGTGDVLAGAIGAMRAAGLDPFAAAGAGVWLHGAAARRLGPAFIADDLADALSAVRG